MKIANSDFDTFYEELNKTKDTTLAKTIDNWYDELSKLNEDTVTEASNRPSQIERLRVAVLKASQDAQIFNKLKTFITQEAFITKIKEVLKAPIDADCSMFNNYYEAVKEIFISHGECRVPRQLVENLSAENAVLQEADKTLLKGHDGHHIILRCTKNISSLEESFLDDIDNLIALTKADHIKLHGIFYESILKYFLSLSATAAEKAEAVQDFKDAIAQAKVLASKSKNSVNVLCSKLKPFLNDEEKVISIETLLSNIHDDLTVECINNLYQECDKITVDLLTIARRDAYLIKGASDAQIASGKKVGESRKDKFEIYGPSKAPQIVDSQKGIIKAIKDETGKDVTEDQVKGGCSGRSGSWRAYFVAPPRPLNTTVKGKQPSKKTYGPYIIFKPLETTSSSALLDTTDGGDFSVGYICETGRDVSRLINYPSSDIPELSNMAKFNHEALLNDKFPGKHLINKGLTFKPIFEKDLSSLESFLGKNITVVNSDRG